MLLKLSIILNVDDTNLTQYIMLCHLNEITHINDIKSVTEYLNPNFCQYSINLSLFTLKCT